MPHDIRNIQSTPNTQVMPSPQSGYGGLGGFMDGIMPFLKIAAIFMPQLRPFVLGVGAAGQGVPQGQPGQVPQPPPQESHTTSPGDNQQKVVEPPSSILKSAKDMPWLPTATSHSPAPVPSSPQPFSSTQQNMGGQNASMSGGSGLGSAPMGQPTDLMGQFLRNLMGGSY